MVDGLAESREWKQAVVRETEGMILDDTIAYFSRAGVRRRFDVALRRAEEEGRAGAREGE
jgi:hypothetical protein